MDHQDKGIKVPLALQSHTDWSGDNDNIMQSMLQQWWMEDDKKASRDSP